MILNDNFVDGSTVNAHAPCSILLGSGKAMMAQRLMLSRINILATITCLRNSSCSFGLILYAAFFEGLR